MKLKVQRLLCLILASALLVGAIPIGASADGIHIDTYPFCNSDAEVYANGTFYSIHGKLFQEYDDGSRTCVFEREVEQIAADRDALYVLQNDVGQWKLLRLSFTGKIDDVVLSSDSEILRFAVTKEYIYYLTNETLYAHDLTSGESKEILKKDNLCRFWLVDISTIEYIAGNDDVIWRYEIDTTTTTNYVNVKSRLHEINDTEYQLTSSSNGVTLSSLKSKYPSGAYWNHSGGGSSHNNPNGYTYTPCGSCHGRNTCPSQPSDCYCNKFDGGVQCMGFALKLAYDYYESSPRSWSRGSLSTLKAGDYIRYKNNGHSIWVTAVNGDTITYADCNSDGKCGIRWDKTVSKSTVASSLTEVKSAPYSLETGSSYEIDTRYPTPFVANTLLWNNPSNGKTPVYKSVGDTVVSDYIYNGYNNVDDECTIHEIYTNGWCKISIPGINGYRYCEKDVFFNMYCDYAPWWVVAQQDIDAFRRWDHGSPRGYVAAGDNVCVVSETEQMYQVVFPTSSGNRCRWVDRCLLWHVYEDIVTAPTCTAQGYTTHKCKFCSNSYKDSYTNPLGHSYNYKATKNPTTSATGTIKGTCSRCSGTTTVTLPKLNTTDYTYKVTKAATCSATGTGRYTWKTTTYGNFYFDVSIAATGHSYSYKATKSPTTSATGTLTGTCPKCSGTTSVTLPKLNTTDYTYKVTKEATCTAAGTGRYTWKTTSYGNFYFDVSIAKTGHSYSYKATKAPTISATGTLTGTCSKCAGTTTVTLPKLNTTDYTYKITKEATCTAAGTGRYTWKTTTYGSFYFDVSIAATGHSYSYKATKAPTTSATGTLTGTCSKCSGTTTVTLPKLNTTDYTYKVTKEATCTAAGTGRYTWKTTTYGSFYFDVNIAAKGHSYTSKVTVPTCTRQGFATYTCHCGDSYVSDYTNALGHDMGDWDTATEPTCTEAGQQIRECSRCDHRETRAVDALGHDWDDGVVTIVPTEELEGEMTYTCERCSLTRTEPIPTLDHEHRYDAIVTAPTCTEKGYTTHSCRCGHSYVDAYVDALGHDMGPWIIVTDAACMEEGLEQRGCSRCDHCETREIAASGHSFTTYVSDDNATCTQDGTRTAVCDRCDATDTKADPGNARGHDFSEWTVVEEPTATTDGLEYRFCYSCGLEETRMITKLDNPFTDVPTGSFYYEPVLWAVAKGITNGTSATTFGPNDQCLRAHVVTFLHRAVGSPAPVSDHNPFTDVKTSDFFYKPVLWAVENGITNGVSATAFGSYTVCNRAAVVTFLWRAAGSPEPISTSHPFTDVNRTDFFYKPVLWAVENGITNGIDVSHFGPTVPCNRAQVVTFLYRAFAND